MHFPDSYWGGRLFHLDIPCVKWLPKRFANFSRGCLLPHAGGFCQYVLAVSPSPICALIPEERVSVRMETRIQFACPPGGGLLPGTPAGRAVFTQTLVPPLSRLTACGGAGEGVCFWGFLSSHWPLSVPVLSSLGLYCELDNKSDIEKASLPPSPMSSSRKCFGSSWPSWISCKLHPRTRR